MSCKISVSKIIYISGVGADQRAFDKLDIKEANEHVYVHWLPLTHANEPFDTYCQRVINHFDINTDDLLIGLSFGGLIVQQIAKQLGNQKVVLLSSFRSKKDLQPLFYWSLRLRLNKILPSVRIPIISDLIAFFLNSWSKNSRAIIKEMLKDADFKFINWCINQINQIDLTDSFKTTYLPLVGNRDLLVSQWTTHTPIAHGSHFMIYDLSVEINEVVNRYLGKAI